MENIYDRQYHIKHAHHASTPTGVELNEWRRGVVLESINQDPRRACRDQIIDWGCGGSGFLKAMRPQGQVVPDGDIIGVDVNPYSVFHAVSLGFKAYTPVMFDEFVSKPDGLRIMTFWDVFEHLQDPRDFLKQYQPDYLVMSLPCLDGFYDAFGRNADIQLWKHHRPLEHLWSFTESSLGSFLKSCGYSTMRVLYGESKYRVDPVLGDKNIMTFVAKRLPPVVGVAQ